MWLPLSGTSRQLIEIHPQFNWSCDHLCLEKIIRTLTWNFLMYLEFIMWQRTFFVNSSNGLSYDYLYLVKRRMTWFCRLFAQNYPFCGRINTHAHLHHLHRVLMMNLIKVFQARKKLILHECLTPIESETT